jgi:hypothetical protein
LLRRALAAALLPASLGGVARLLVLSVPRARAVTDTLPLSATVTLAWAISLALALALALFGTIRAGAGRSLREGETRRKQEQRR